MASKKVREALKLTEDSSNSKSRKVCNEQCNILKEIIEHIAKFVKEVELRLVHHGPVVDEIAFAIRRASDLIKCDQQGSWILAALSRQEAREYFQEVHSELCSCIDLLRAVFPGCIQMVASGELEAAAMRDRMQLVTAALEEEQKLKRRTILKKKDAQIMCSTLVQTLLQNEPPTIEHRQIKTNKLLGGGNFGAVYEASWLGYTFAVKVFAQGDVKSFPRELAALSLHRHPNILPILGHSFDTDKKQHCMIMEKMEMDLENLLEKKSSKHRFHDNLPLPLLATISIMLHIAKAMAWLHSKMVIHRDLKPQNVLINTVSHGDEYHYEVKIADFGLARTNFITSQVSYATPKAGTKIFTAPEVWNATGDMPKYSKKSDVYSYGMLCYQLLTGRKPFHSVDTRSSTFMLNVTQGMRPEFPSGCPLPLEELIKGCWHSSPDPRPYFKEICDELQRIKTAAIITKTH